MFRSLGALNSAVENEEDSSHSRASKRIGRAVSRAQGPLRKSSDDLDLREAKKTWWGPLHDTKGPVWSGIEGQSGRREFPPHALLGSALDPRSPQRSFFSLPRPRRADGSASQSEFAPGVRGTRARPEESVTLYSMRADHWFLPCTSPHPMSPVPDPNPSGYCSVKHGWGYSSQQPFLLGPPRSALHGKK